MSILQRRPPGWLLAVAAIVAVAAGLQLVETALPEHRPDPGVTPVFIERAKSRREVRVRGDGVVVIRHGTSTWQVQIDDDAERETFVDCVRAAIGDPEADPGPDAEPAPEPHADFPGSVDACLRSALAPGPETGG